MNLDRAKLNLLLGTLAFIISSAGSVLLHIVLATTIYKQSGSGILTSLFLSLQWLPALVVMGVKSNWEDGVDPRKRWMRLDLLSALLTVPVLFFVDEPNYVVLFFLLFARGIVDHVTRIIKTVASRYIFPTEKSTLYASILQTGYHFGIGLAAVVGIFLGERFSVKSVVLLDIASFVLAASLMWFVKTLNAPVDLTAGTDSSLRKRMASYVAAVKSDRRLFFSVLIVPLSSAIFQGTYSVFQPIFPLKVLKLSPSAVTVSYVLASMAILGGSSFFAFLSRKTEFFKDNYNRTKTIIFALSAVSAGSYLMSVLGRGYIESATFFTLMILTFEMIYMFGYAGIVAYAPKGELGSVFGISFCIGCTLGSLFAVLTGAMLDLTGDNFPLVTSGAMTIYFAVLGAGYLIYRRWQIPVKSIPEVDSKLACATAP